MDFMDLIGKKVTIKVKNENCTILMQETSVGVWEKIPSTPTDDGVGMTVTDEADVIAYFRS